MVITRVTPPNSWAEASITQILIIFVPLIATYFFTFNLFLNHLIFSFIFALSLFILTIFQTLHILNLTNSTIVLVFTTLLIWFFKQNRFRNLRTKRLTKKDDIPTLTKLTTKQQ